FFVYGYRRFVALEDEQGETAGRDDGPAATRDDAPRSEDTDDTDGTDGGPHGDTAPHGEAAGDGRNDDAPAAPPPQDGRGQAPPPAGGAGTPRASDRARALVDRVLGRSGPAYPQVTEIPAELLPQRAATPSAHRPTGTPEDRSLDEYNDYLARLDEHATKGRGR